MPVDINFYSQAIYEVTDYLKDNNIRAEAKLRQIDPSNWYSMEKIVLEFDDPEEETMFVLKGCKDKLILDILDRDRGMDIWLVKYP